MAVYNMPKKWVCEGVPSCGCAALRPTCANRSKERFLCVPKRAAPAGRALSQNTLGGNHKITTHPLLLSSPNADCVPPQAPRPTASPFCQRRASPFLPRACCPPPPDNARAQWRSHCSKADTRPANGAQKRAPLAWPGEMPPPRGLDGAAAGAFGFGRLAPSVFWVSTQSQNRFGGTLQNPCSWAVHQILSGCPFFCLVSLKRYGGCSGEVNVAKLQVESLLA